MELYLKYSNGHYTGVCGSCPANCDYCSLNNTWCTSCQNSYGYVVDQNGKITNKCSSCPESCSSCTYDSNNCTDCDYQSGFIRDSNGIKTGRFAYCNKCDNDYTICESCNYGYGFVPGAQGNPTGLCAKCIDNCDSCKLSNTCESCDSGYVLTTINNVYKCEACPQNYARCNASNITQCYQCRTRFGFSYNSNGDSTGLCVPCTTQHCTNCRNNYTKCSDCDSGYVRVENTCVSCPENCIRCNSPDYCEYCNNTGYYLNETTKQCNKCSEICEYCNDYSYCSSCESGYTASLQQGSNYGKCIPCPANCIRCDREDNKICYYCQYGYVLQASNGQCVKCPDNCINCDDSMKCLYCNEGYGIIYEDGVSTNKCGTCSDSNCQYCPSNRNTCDTCKEGFEIDTYPHSPHYLNCVPENFVTECSIQNCMKCIYNMPNSCAACNNGYELTRDYQCNVVLDGVEKEKYERVEQNINETDCNKDGNCNINTENYNTTNDQQQLVLVFPIGNNDKLNIAFETKANQNVAIKIPHSYSEINVSCNNEVSIIPITSSLKINLDDKIVASIVDAQGEITIDSSTKNNKEITLNEVQPSSTNFVLIPNIPVTIKSVDFGGKNPASLIVNSDKEVKIESLTVQQKGEAVINNVVINGKVSFGLSSSLEVNKQVNLESATIEVPFNELHSQGWTDKAPLNGYFGSIPKSIVINNLRAGQVLAEERLLIAESFDNFCNKTWEDRIVIQATGTKIDERKCENDEINSNGKQIYRLYAQQKKPDEEGKGGNKLSAAAIAGIVIAVVVVVGVVIFLLVYFLVIKKKKQLNESSDQEAGNAEEV